MSLRGVGLRSFLGPIISSVVRVSNEMAPGFAIPGARFGVNIRDPTQRSGSWQFPCKCIDIRVYTA